MSRRYSDRPFTDDTELTADLLNQLVVSFDRAIDQLERFSPEWQQQIDAFNTNALKRVNDAVAPLMERIRTAIQGGFLVAQTQDVYALEQDAEIIFKIPEDSRVAFRPTPFLAVMAPDEIDDWALAQTLQYNEVTGDLTLKILFVHGSGAARAGWTIAASSGVVEAVGEWVAEVRTKHAEVVAAAEETQAAAILIAGGPVSSVVGKAGVVTLADLKAGGVAAASDVEDALADKADTSAVTEALALKANTSSLGTAAWLNFTADGTLAGNSDGNVPTEKAVKSYVDGKWPLLHVVDEKPEGTNGVVPTASSWNIRELNTVRANDIPGASLASNQITLPAGTYFAQAVAAAYRVERNKLRLYSVTSDTTLMMGVNDNAATASASTSSTASLCGRFTLSGTAVITLDHYVFSAAAAALGWGMNQGPEVYAELLIWKVA